MALQESNFPTTKPELTLDFANSRCLDPRITFIRASTGTYVDERGILQTAPVNVARFDHNPTTGESLGLLVEEPRTNSIRNNTMVGAVAGTPGTIPTNWSDVPTSNGLNRQIVGIGTQNGITYIDIRYSGTATAAASITIQPELGSVTVAATGQSWTASSWLALVGGSTSGLTVVQRITGRTAAGGFLEFTSTSVSLSSTLTRYVASITMANALTLRVSSDIDINTKAAGAAIDITLRIGLPQLEQGAFATSPILTTTAAATRSADVASITGTAFSSWYNQTEGSFFSQSSVTNPAAYTGRVYTAGVGTDNISTFRQSDFQPVLRTRVSNIDQALFGLGATWTDSLPRQLGQAYRVNDFAGALNGGSVSVDTSGSLPNISVLSIGNQDSASFFNGHIRRLTYWRQRLPNSTLQTLTSS